MSYQGIIIKNQNCYYGIQKRKKEKEVVFVVSNHNFDLIVINW